MFFIVVCKGNYVLIVKVLIKVGVDVKFSLELYIVFKVVLDYCYMGIIY